MEDYQKIKEEIEFFERYSEKQTIKDILDYLKEQLGYAEQTIKEKREFENLYNLYLNNYYFNHEKSDNPACYDEWVDNDLPYLESQYRYYLKEVVLDDDDFDVQSTEDFWTWAEVELSTKRDKEGNLI